MIVCGWEFNKRGEGQVHLKISRRARGGESVTPILFKIIRFRIIRFKIIRFIEFRKSYRSTGPLGTSVTTILCNVLG